MGKEFVTNFLNDMKIKGRCNVLTIGISTIVAFISTNIYWLLTVQYVRPVKRFGEQGVLSGFDAAKRLINENGFDAYLYGMGWYFVITLACCMFMCLLETEWKKVKGIVTTLLLSAAASVTLYLLNFSVYVTNETSKESSAIEGRMAIHEVGYLWLFVSLLSVSFLFFVTFSVNAAIYRYFTRARR